MSASPSPVAGRARARKRVMLGIAGEGPEEDDEEIQRLDGIFLDCWEDSFESTLDEGLDDDAAASEAPTSTRSGSPSSGKPTTLLAVQNLARCRSEIAKYCFNGVPSVSRRALRHLIRILENSPVGHPDVAFGLLPLASYFIENMPIKVFESLPLDISVSVTRCIFLIVEGVRAEHLIGNLPAISQELAGTTLTREKQVAEL